jgi:shikimate dehydrogenase
MLNDMFGGVVDVTIDPRREAMTTITGRTRLWLILADPIVQVKTPQMINGVIAERGVDGVMIPMHVGSDHLADAVKAIRGMKNCGGMIITVPHKSAIVDLLDDVSPNARLIGAANAIRREADGRLKGEILDGLGFVAGLKQHGIDPKGLSAYLAGAGGAANAIAFALAEAGVTRLTIANRTRAKAEDLARRLAIAFPALPVAIGTPDAAGHDLLVNATALGMKLNDALPFDPASLSPKQIVADIIMDPEETAIMAAARGKGCRVHPGKPMLLAQRELMAEFLGIG